MRVFQVLREGKIVFTQPRPKADGQKWAVNVRLRPKADIQGFADDPAFTKPFWR